MASGHVIRANRPNTWLHRPALHVKKTLASREPSTHGTERPLASAPRQVCFLTLSRPVANVVTIAADDPERTSRSQILGFAKAPSRVPSHKQISVLAWRLALITRTQNHECRRAMREHLAGLILHPRFGGNDLPPSRHDAAFAPNAASGRQNWT